MRSPCRILALHGARQAILALSLALTVASCTAPDDSDRPPDERRDQVEEQVERLERTNFWLKVTIGVALGFVVVATILTVQVLGAVDDVLDDLFGFGAPSNGPGLSGR